jgi:hypothetical protein
VLAAMLLISPRAGQAGGRHRRSRRTRGGGYEG